jgi:hypothetical protein
VRCHPHHRRAGSPKASFCQIPGFPPYLHNPQCLRALRQQYCDRFNQFLPVPHRISSFSPVFTLFFNLYRRSANCAMGGSYRIAQIQLGLTGLPGLPGCEPGLGGGKEMSGGIVLTAWLTEGVVEPG